MGETKKAKTKEKPDATPVIVESFKGFNKDFACTGGGSPFQFEIGKTYSVSGRIEACANGFHACETPFDVWSYYPASGGTRYAVVEQSGDLDRHNEDSKIASATITIKAELTLPEFIKRGVAWLVSHAKTNLATGDRGHAAATGYRGHAAVKGEHAVAFACGFACTVESGPIGSAISLTCISDEDYRTILAVRSSKVGENGVKPFTRYRLDKDGNFVECEARS